MSDLQDFSRHVALPDDLRGRTQTLTTVTRAETARLLRQGGLVPAMLASGVAGLLVGLAALPVVARVSRDAADGAAVATSLSLAASATALVLAVAVAVHTAAHTTRGSGPTTLALVPDRARLVHGRSLAVAWLAGTQTGTVAIVVGSVAAGHSGGEGAYALACGGALAAAVAGALLVTVAAAVGTLVDHPVGALLTLGGWWAVLPLTGAAVAQMAPGPLGWVAGALLRSAPPVLVAGAADPIGEAGVELLATLRDLLALAGWTVVGVAGAVAVLRRRSVTRGRAYEVV